VSYQSVFRADLFAGQRVLVTGGGSGIGRCIAHELAALGADVVLLGRNEEKLQRVQAELVEDGYQASYFSCDIRDEAKVKAVVAEIQAAGKVTGLVNNAGGQFPAPLAAISKNGFEKVVQSNLVGGFLVARELFTQGMNKTGGSIVNIIADMWGGMPMMGHSGAARAGMLNLTKTAAVEWASCNIRVNAVAPGIIASSGLDTYDAGMQTVLKQAAKSIPAKRLGTESEISSAVVWLLSEGAAFTSGCCMEVDGAGPLGGRMFPLAAHKGWPQFDGFHRATHPEFLKD
jgi:citronellol/citronellal dehydrogenase